MAAAVNHSLSYPISKFCIRLLLRRYLRRVHYLGKDGRPHQNRSGEAKECQDLRLPGVPNEEAGRGHHEEVWGVQRGDVLLRRPPKAALASPQ